MRSITGMQFPVILFITLLTFFSSISIASYILTPQQSIKDGETLVSEGNLFELGFFSPRNSKNRYLGIWYKKIPIQTVVWILNRDNPIKDSSGILKIHEGGQLVLLNEGSGVIWSMNLSKAENPIAQLLDSGNFVIREANNDNPENYLWQSFDFPTNTLLPGMKLGWDLKSGMNRFLTSWKNTDDPSTGDYTFSVDPHGFPEIFLSNRQIRNYRSGPWNGVQFSGVPEMRPLDGLNLSFVVNQDEIYYKFDVNSESIVSKLIVNESGVLQLLLWNDTTIFNWNVFWYAPKDQCDNYRECGPHGICDTNNSPVCNCVKGFEPKYQKNWNSGEWSGGCVRKMKLNCNESDEFLVLKGIKMPDTSSSVFNKSMVLRNVKQNAEIIAHVQLMRSQTFMEEEMVV